MKLRLDSKHREAGDIWSFFFEPVEPLEWVAGQSIRLELPRATWGYDERRFTIASAPLEGHIRITTRVSSSEFKRTLANLRPGAEIDGHNIEGDFIWDDADKPKIFLAAGIGITPFRAILAGRKGKEMVTLLYSSRLENPVFIGELKDWLGEKLHVINGRLDASIVKETIPNWQESIVYISGPEQMVNDIFIQLKKAGLPEKNIRLDLFTGNVQY